MPPKFSPGRNIAMKIPPHEFSRTVAFYREILGLAVLAEHPESIVFDFGGKRLWLDRVPHLSQTEIWLAVETADAPAASSHLAAKGVIRCDDIEPLPEVFSGFWIVSPAGIVHLVSGEGES